MVALDPWQSGRAKAQRQILDGTVDNGTAAVLRARHEGNKPSGLGLLFGDRKAAPVGPAVAQNIRNGARIVPKKDRITDMFPGDPLACRTQSRHVFGVSAIGRNDLRQGQPLRAFFWFDWLDKEAIRPLRNSRRYIVSVINGFLFQCGNAGRCDREGLRGELLNMSFYGLSRDRRRCIYIKGEKHRAFGLTACRCDSVSWREINSRAHVRRGSRLKKRRHGCGGSVRQPAALGSLLSCAVGWSGPCRLGPGAYHRLRSPSAMLSGRTLGCQCRCQVAIQGRLDQPVQRHGQLATPVRVFIDGRGHVDRRKLGRHILQPHREQA